MNEHLMPHVIAQSVFQPWKDVTYKMSHSISFTSGKSLVSTRAVTVADFYHRGGNGPTTAGGAVLCIFIYIYNSETQT